MRLMRYGRRQEPAALARMGVPPDAGGEGFAHMIVQIKPLAFTLWFGAMTALNASIAQRIVVRHGLMVAQPARWSLALLPGWYWKLALAVGVAALVTPGGAGFAVQSAALMLAVPLALQGLAVAHVTSLGKPGRPVLLGGVYLGIGVLTAASYALFMDLTRPALGATQFSTFMAATNGCEAWATYSVGRLAGSLGYGPAFLGMAFASLLSLPILWWLRREPAAASAGPPEAAG